ncbi:MAG: homoserine dehydrogenase, partial [Caldilinea sp.]|nr:homoserine dehydrogenase [Caldilinea sp.]MDW8440617.1 homoserine dehydrogenase [Caldilineaceae bacterium]
MMTTLRTVDLVLIGLGAVNRNVLRILEWKAPLLAQRHGLAFRVVCAADSSGVAVDPSGFDPAALRRFKEAGGRICELDGFLAGTAPADALSTLACDLVLEASPLNLETGEPGLSVVHAALRCGVS